MSDNNYSLQRELHKSPFVKDEQRYLPMSTIQEEIIRKTPTSQHSQKVSSRSTHFLSLTVFRSNETLAGIKYLEESAYPLTWLIFVKSQHQGRECRGNSLVVKIAE